MIDGTSDLCYSARFVPPFAQVLSTYECFDRESLQKLKAIDPVGRITTAVANELAVRQVAATGDRNLGLKAARAMPLGAAGPLDFAIQSASTVRESMVVARRFIRAYSDVLDVRLDGEDSRVVVKLQMSIPAPRAIFDFTMGAWYANHIRLPLAGAPGLECWFAHRQPSNTNEYERTFEGAVLRFEAPSYGLAFHRGHLEAPLPCAEAAVHALLCQHVQLTLGSGDPAADPQQPGPRNRVERPPAGRPVDLRGGSPPSHERENPRAETRTGRDDLSRGRRRLEAGARRAIPDE